MQFTIREILPTDVDRVYSLLIELALNEKIKDRLKLTPEKMHHDLFSDQGDWHGFVVGNETVGVIGFCLFTIANINRSYNTSPVIYIDDFYVKPEFRQYGLGKGLLNIVKQIAIGAGIHRLELWCLKDNELGQTFYQKQGWEKLDMMDIYELSVADNKPL
ncbi:MAG: GNAT family N-acetyltransferase [Candidatus Berkiella sp.]